MSKNKVVQDGQLVDKQAEFASLSGMVSYGKQIAVDLNAPSLVYCLDLALEVISKELAARRSAAP